MHGSLGALARVAAFGISAVMIDAIVLIHRHVGFFMNWTGAQAGHRAAPDRDFDRGAPVVGRKVTEEA
jgi:hypothetical protein